MRGITPRKKLIKTWTENFDPASSQSTCGWSPP